MSLIASFARIKPTEVDGVVVDKTGGNAGTKQLTGFDEKAKTISCGGKVFNHLTGVIEPSATQSDVYASAAQPLVKKWIDGFDVDLLSYGQTGSGKTFTMFGPPFSMEKAASDLATTADDGDILKPEHGFILRSGLEALNAVDAINASGEMAAVLHGSMIEMSLLSLVDQTVTDLLNQGEQTFVDQDHHVQGALMVPLRSPQEVVRMAAAVETRLVRGTKMNDTSSRSHCVAIFTLSVFDKAKDAVRTSRLQFFDMMGSERFKGGNSAHDESKSAKSTESGWEGIFANVSLSSLVSAVDSAAANRRKGSSKKAHNALIDFALTNLLSGSLQGGSLTGMITCVSQSPRNGDESFLTLTYGEGMAKLLNAPKPQPFVPFSKYLKKARDEHATSSAIVKRGVQGKYQAKRVAEMVQWGQIINILEGLSGIQSQSGGGGGGGADGKQETEDQKD